MSSIDDRQSMFSLMPSQLADSHALNFNRLFFSLAYRGHRQLKQFSAARRECGKQSNLNRHLELWGLDTKIPWIRADRGNLAEAIEKLLLNAELREEVARDCRTFMLQYYSAEVGIQVFLFYALQAVKNFAARS